MFPTLLSENLLTLFPQGFRKLKSVNNVENDFVATNQYTFSIKLLPLSPREMKNI